MRTGGVGVDARNLNMQQSCKMYIFDGVCSLLATAAKRGQCGRNGFSPKIDNIFGGHVLSDRSDCLVITRTNLIRPKSKYHLFELPPNRMFMYSRLFVCKVLFIEFIYRVYYPESYV